MAHVQPLRLNTTAVASVRSSVTRLRDHSFTVTHTSFCEAIAREYHRERGVDVGERDNDRGYERPLWADVSEEEAFDAFPGVSEAVHDLKVCRE